MSALVKAFVGASIHDGTSVHENCALAIHRDGRRTIEPLHDLPSDLKIETLSGGIITPGFVDLQVNGGGGEMFNDHQTVETLHLMAKAHASLGTVAILPTLITDTPEITRAAIKSVEEAIAQKIPGIVGIHLEGPHLSIARKGAHDPKLIRPMADDDLKMLLNAAERIGNVKLTIAPENVTLAQVKMLSDAGVIVSIGHSNTDYDTAMAYFNAGAKCVTHLFNAMSQMGNREPGLVGAALARDDIYAGLIADGIHVHSASMKNALTAKSRSNRIFLVTDAMATAGSSIGGFTINGREVFRSNSRLTLADGTLAGADLDLSRALSILIDELNEDVAGAVARATSTPVELLRDKGSLGTIISADYPVLYFGDGFTEPKILPVGGSELV